MNFLIESSGLGPLKTAVNLSPICWSTHLKKSFLGGLGTSLKIYPKESSSDPMPLWGGIIIPKLVTKLLARYWPWLLFWFWFYGKLMPNFDK